MVDRSKLVLPQIWWLCWKYLIILFVGGKHQQRIDKVKKDQSTVLCATYFKRPRCGFGDIPFSPAVLCFFLPSLRIILRLMSVFTIRNWFFVIKEGCNLAKRFAWLTNWCLMDIVIFYNDIAKFIGKVIIEGCKYQNDKCGLICNNPSFRLYIYNYKKVVDLLILGNETWIRLKARSFTVEMSNVAKY